MFNVETVREDFPILKREVHGKPLVYFDNASTTQKPRQVIDALVRYYETYNANVHRGVHTLSEEATDAYEEARMKVARFIKAPHGHESVVFVRNTTEGINLVANAWGRKFLQPGDEVLISVVEHHSNMIPWQLITKERGAVLRYVDIDEEGRLRMDELESDDWASYEDGGPGSRIQRARHQSHRSDR